MQTPSYNTGMEHLYKRRPDRWPQMSLKGLLVVVTLSALATAWGAAEHKRHERALWKERERKFIRDSQIYRLPMPHLVK